jgi:hypothetical protein
MIKLTFETKINASPEKVWDTLWNDDTYRKWTSVFSPGSYAESEWKEGHAVKFLNGEGGGMFSRIEKMIKGEVMAFKHLGVIKDGKELPPDEETEKWSGSMEVYTLKREGDHTLLIAEMDTVEEFREFFDDTFPKALGKLKELAEG